MACVQQTVTGFEWSRVPLQQINKSGEFGVILVSVAQA